MTKKLNIKTSEQIFYEFPRICYAGIEHSNNNDINKCNIHKNKEWVCVDDLKEWLYKNTLKPNASCQDSRRQMETRIERNAFKIVLEELNKSGGAE